MSSDKGIKNIPDSHVIPVSDDRPHLLTKLEVGAPRTGPAVSAQFPLPRTVTLHQNAEHNRDVVFHRSFLSPSTEDPDVLSQNDHTHLLKHPPDKTGN
jgi:hypothetical protein